MAAKSTSIMDKERVDKIVGAAYKIEFPTIISDELNTWITYVATSRNTSRNFVLLNLLPSIGTSMGEKSSIQGTNDYNEKPNIYMLTLGISNAGKSQAYTLTGMPAIKGLVSIGEDRHCVCDGFSEKGLLAHISEHKAVLASFDEMGNFLKTMGNNDTNSTFCNLYEGRIISNKKSTPSMKSRKIEIANYSFSIAGFQQPLPFLTKHSHLWARHDGLAGRMLLSCPEPKRFSPSVVYAAETALENYTNKDCTGLLKRVHRMHKMGRTYKFDAEARELFDDILETEKDLFNASVECVRDTGASSSKEFETKTVRNTLKLCLLLHVLENCWEEKENEDETIPLEISVETLRRASTLTDYFATQQLALLSENFRKVPRREDDNDEFFLEKKILLHRGLIVLPRNVSANLWGKRKATTEKVKSIMTALAGKGLGNAVDGGRRYAFIKKFPLSAEELLEYGITTEMYVRSAGERNDKVSEDQREHYRGKCKELEAYQSNLNAII